MAGSTSPDCTKPKQYYEISGYGAAQYLTTSANIPFVGISSRTRGSVAVDSLEPVTVMQEEQAITLKRLLAIDTVYGVAWTPCRTSLFSNMIIHTRNTPY